MKSPPVSFTFDATALHFGASQHSFRSDQTENHLPVELPLYPEYEKKEKCGLFGIWGSDEAARICYQGLFAQQHRGQESAGIVVSDGTTLNGHAGMGLVSHVFAPRMLREELAGHAGIGHVRYSTTGSSKLCNAQPLLRQYLMG